MIEKVVMLQIYSGSSGEIGNLLNKLEQFGFFTYVLPFLLVFALVYGVLLMTNIFKEQKAINGIIALVIGLMALQFDIVPRFFAELFPRLGVGLAIILVAIILLGIFSPEKAWVVYAFFGIAAIVFIIILVKTAGSVGWYSGYWWYDNWQVVAAAIFILALVGIIVGSSSPPDDTIKSPLLKRLFENA
jgi:hypothetical protein